MDTWTDAVDTKAAIVLDQFGAACILVRENDGDFEGLPELYLDLLRPLYADEYNFCRLSDSSDLLARYTGPAVDSGTPKMTLVTSMFSKLQKQVQYIAQSIAALEGSGGVEWPPELSPQLAGIASGSFFVGIRLPSPSEITDKQGKSPNASETAGNQLASPGLSDEFEQAETTRSGQSASPGISDELHGTVIATVQQLSIVPDFVSDEGVDESMADEISDPTIRGILISAACELAPTGKMGIDEVFLYGKEVRKSPPKALTVASRQALQQYLRQHPPPSIEVALPYRPARYTQIESLAEVVAVQERPIKKGSFQGLVRNIDLDQRSFELKQVEGIGVIQCSYSKALDHHAPNLLNATVLVKGRYEEDENRRPILMEVTTVEMLKATE